jgi:ATP-binding cassette, subfamily B (MDR/TAP), member 6
MSYLLISAEVQTVASTIQIHDRILEFPDGYNTRVGEHGSGGERQRVAIARVFLRKPKPKIILFDEPSSALDPNTEQKILVELSASFKDYTKIMMTYQLGIVAGANLILCIKGGIIVERGTYAELISLDRVYRKMWDEVESSEEEDNKKEDSI